MCTAYPRAISCASCPTSYAAWFAFIWSTQSSNKRQAKRIAAKCNCRAVYEQMPLAQRLLRFAAFLRLRTSDGCGRAAPAIFAFGSSPAIVRRCALKSSRRIAASCSRLVGRVIGHRLSTRQPARLYACALPANCTRHHRESL